jgi:hypothetical protein
MAGTSPAMTVWKSIPRMPALAEGIHVFSFDSQQQVVDGRDKPGHDNLRGLGIMTPALSGPRS